MVDFFILADPSYVLIQDRHLGVDTLYLTSRLNFGDPDYTEIITYCKNMSLFPTSSVWGLIVQCYSGGSLQIVYLKSDET